MKRMLLIFTLLLFFSNMMEAQVRSIGDWVVHLPYGKASSVAINGTQVYTGTEHSFFFVYDQEDSSVQPFSKLNGFAEPEVAKIEYFPEKDWTLIAYKNANLDLIKGNEIINISDIKDKTIIGDKSINYIHFREQFAYLSCGFGIVVVDLEREEIKDTYFIAPGGERIVIYATADDGNTIMAATEMGVFYADLSDPNLINFNNWTLYEESDGILADDATALNHFDGRFHAAVNETLYQLDGETWTPVYDAGEGWRIIHATSKIIDSEVQMVLTENLIEVTDTTEPKIENARVTLLHNNFEPVYYTNTFLKRPVEASIDENGNIWVADNWFGLLKIENGEVRWPITGSGPDTEGVWTLELSNNELLVGPANLSSNWTGRDNRSGFFSYKDGKWSSQKFDRADGETVRDFVDILPGPDGILYLASYGDGLVVTNRENLEEYTLYNNENSSIQNTVGDGSYRVSGLGLDKEGNLWMSNYGAVRPISVKTPGDESEALWQSFLPSMDLGDARLTEVVVDAYGHKWIVVRNEGVLVFDSGEDPLDLSDDRYRLFKYIDFFNGIPSNDVNCLVQDKQDEIWAGTNDGVAVFFCTNDPFNNNCEFSKPILPVPGSNEADYLLTGIRINSIAVDAADRKWVGTNSGVFLLSPDGKETIERFTVQNSALLSDVVRDIVVNDETGEVFFGTEKGISSYQGDAQQAEFVHGEVLVYPNPVRPDYEGMIAIKGLANNAVVKITDISGQLVYETTALGGQAVWDGRNYNGTKAQTGVYLILSSNEDGSDNQTAKVFIVN